jgi:DNA-binding SARP family transcriptional activator
LGVSVTAQIRLIGEPAIELNGEVRLIRGHQTWAVLARLLLSSRPLDRRTLAAEVFADTADPLGSLRWSLAALRKALDCATCLTDDPIEINFPPHITVDVWDLAKGYPTELVAGRLLNGIEPRTSAEFETWLLVERERISALMEEAAREATLVALSEQRHTDAIRHAELGTRLSPFDERMHVLLVKSLAAAGRHEAALAQVELTERQFLEELGEKPSPALRSAARETVSSPPVGIAPSVYLKSLIESGLAALSAGAADAGIDCLRRAVHEAEKAGDRFLQGRAALELGTGLIHAVRGYDDEGSIFLLQAVQLAGEVGASSIATTALRELGYVEALSGRRPAAEGHLEAALASASSPDELAGVHSVIAFNLLDWGRSERAFHHYDLALDMARAGGSVRREIWTLGMGAWGHIEHGRWEQAEGWLARCLELVERERWASFQPWPIALLAECSIRQGKAVYGASSELETAFALSCQLGDPCWEGVVARSIGLGHLEQGEVLAASKWFDDGYRRTSRETDGYGALQVKLLGDRAVACRRLNQFSMADGLARQWVAQAARRHMDLEVTRAAQFLMLGPQ